MCQLCLFYIKIDLLFKSSTILIRRPNSLLSLNSWRILVFPYFSDLFAKLCYLLFKFFQLPQVAFCVNTNLFFDPLYEALVNSNSRQHLHLDLHVSDHLLHLCPIDHDHLSHTLVQSIDLMLELFQSTHYLSSQDQKLPSLFNLWVHHNPLCLIYTWFLTVEYSRL